MIPKGEVFVLFLVVVPIALVLGYCVGYTVHWLRTIATVKRLESNLHLFEDGKKQRHAAAIIDHYLIGPNEGVNIGIAASEWEPPRDGPGYPSGTSEATAGTSTAWKGGQTGCARRADR